MSARRLPHEAPEGIAAEAGRLIANIERVIVGKRGAVELVVTALLSGGHLLLQDVPGVGKTMLARSLARSIGGEAGRIQCTPDLLPADITGSSVIDQRAVGAGGGVLEWRFVPGPIFANVVLADELNRATPRTQAAFLEPLDEGQVTVDGRTHPLPQPFFLLATLNPSEHHGVYPLPEGQLDRFALSTSLGYPGFEDELQILASHVTHHPIADLGPVLSLAAVVELIRQVRTVHVSDTVRRYALALVTRSRTAPGVVLGCSPRAGIAILRAAQARAAMDGRAFVLPDDVKALAPAVMPHRMITRPEAGGAVAIVEELLQSVEAPPAPEGRAHF